MYYHCPQWFQPKINEDQLPALSLHVFYARVHTYIFFIIIIIVLGVNNYSIKT